jgi:hypothetical protein
MRPSGAVSKQGQLKTGLTTGFLTQTFADDRASLRERALSGSLTAVTTRTDKILARSAGCETCGFLSCYNFQRGTHITETTYHCVVGAVGPEAVRLLGLGPVRKAVTCHHTGTAPYFQYFVVFKA